MFRFFRLTKQNFAITLIAAEMQQNQMSGRHLVKIAACGKIKNYKYV